MNGLPKSMRPALEEMLDVDNLHAYQRRAINHLLTHPRAFLWLFMGAGKTPITLSVIKHLREHNIIRAALVLGPLRVVQSVWRQEAAKWRHLQGLKFTLIHGNPRERMRALARPADVYLTNYENLTWLSAQLQHYYINQGTLLPFDLLVLDESTKMKSVETRRYMALIPLLPYFNWRYGLTGTPASNGLEDLFGQFLAIDDGKRLGQNFYDFVAQYFTKSDFRGYRNTPTPEGEAYIHRVTSDIVLEMNQNDYLELPPFIVNDIMVELPPQHREQYDRLERELFTELDNGAELEVTSAAAKTNKLLQFANGAAITNSETGEWERVHDLKLDALEDIIEEASGEPVLVAYNYRADAERIMKRFPYARNLSGLTGDAFNRTLLEWVGGGLRLLLAHPASAGHGVDRLQKRGNILVWFGLNWSLELTLQFNARLHRQGQSRPVVCHRILANDTMDEAVSLALDYKEQTQDTLRAAVAEYRRRREGTTGVAQRQTV